MRIKAKLWRVFVLVLTSSVAILLSPVVVPLLMWRNTRAYADKYAWIPGIHAGGGVTSGVSALVYFVILISILGGVAVATTGGTGTIDSIHSNDVGPTTSTPSRMSTTVVAETPTATATPTSTATPTTPPTGTPGKSRTEKYDHFRGTYTSGLAKLNLKVLDAKINTNSETLSVTYELRDPHSENAIGGDEEYTTLGYVATVDEYRGNEHPESDKTWIPKRLNITAKMPDGQIYSTGYVKYKWAVRMIDGEADSLETMVRYYGTVEYGPGHNKYGE